MDGYVIVATKGRPHEVSRLVLSLARQTVSPKAVVVVGACEDDVAGLPRPDAMQVDVVLAPKPGLTAQRNAGIEHLVGRGGVGARDPYFVVFFDDDFRPTDTWLARAGGVFAAQRDVVALTGWVLADGVKGPGLTDEDASLYLRGLKSPERHWASGPSPMDVGCAYGCNMAFRDHVITRCRFDENLPLYGWQEDQDFTSQARAYGRAVYSPECKGVHLGTRGGRVSGVCFGYSQIANPLYLMRKGTMGIRKGTHFLLRAAIANSVKSVIRSGRADYPGRLHGNVAALSDLLRRRCHPLRVLDFV
jgi:GT2 family glycosyltransferase